MRWMLVVALCIGSAAAQSPEWQARTQAAQEIDAGESAPDWLVDSETYAIGTTDWDTLAQSKVAFVTHCPVNREYFERCHALGIRCFPYVTFYQGFAGQSYEDIRLSEHPEFIEVDADGNLKRSGFWDTEDAKNMYTTCPNVQAYQDAMVEWVRKILELGADGVFVDNLGARVPCYGPKFGKHEHVYDDQDHAFAMLLKRVRELIKQYKPEGALLGNSASPTTLPKEYWKYLDAEMLESYICTWVSTDRWFDWETHWNKAGKDLQPYVRAGKQIQALSYIGHTPYGVREDAFFCYASARLAGFVWNGGWNMSDPELADLYRLRLGKPLTDELEENGVHYRVFTTGLVAVNPDKENAAAITLKPPVPTNRLFNLFGAGAQAWQSDAGKGYSIDVATKHGGARGITCALNDAAQSAGAVQVITLDQETAAPITISGWSKTQEVSGASDANYALYADIVYRDGENLYGQVAPFSVGTHDWEFQSVTVTPAKPIKSLTLHALFRYKTGKVWFDDVSIKDAQGNERLQNGGFEERGKRGSLIDLAEGKLEIPAFSGRVYLFGSDTQDQLAKTGPRLTIATEPGLGNVRFRIDGFDFWTYSGRWTTEYVKGSDFGRLSITFDAPGTHTVEVVDTVPADMQTPAGYGSGERLGQFMDPSNPTQPSEGRKFRFREWQGKGTAPKIELDVSQDTTLTAAFDVEKVP